MLRKRAHCLKVLLLFYFISSDKKIPLQRHSKQNDKLALDWISAHSYRFFDSSERFFYFLTELKIKKSEKFNNVFKMLSSFILADVQELNQGEICLGGNLHPRLVLKWVTISNRSPSPPCLHVCLKITINTVASLQKTARIKLRTHLCNSLNIPSQKIL